MKVFEPNTELVRQYVSLLQEGEPSVSDLYRTACERCEVCLSEHRYESLSVEVARLLTFMDVMINRVLEHGVSR